MASYNIKTVGQLARHGYVIAVKCRCGNNATLTPARLMNAGVARLVELDDRLVCKVCGFRPHDVCMVLPEK